MIEYFIANWWSTFSVAAVASLLALVTSLIFSLVALRARLFGTFLGGIAAISQSFPLQAIAPLILISLGTGFQTKLLIAFLIAFFPLYGTLSSALKRRSNEVLPFLRSCGVTEFTSEVPIIVKASTAEIFGSIKIAFTLATLGAVVAEFIMPNRGLGYVIIVSITNFNFFNIYLSVAILAIQGITIFSLFSILELRAQKIRGEA